MEESERATTTMRDYIAQYLDKNQYESVYQFGVFNGDSMQKLLEIFRDAGRHLEGMYGFDSFIGFPKTDENYQDTWVEGGLNAVEHLGAKSVDDCLMKILDRLNPHVPNTASIISLTPGFFCDTLTDEETLGFKLGPAALIDIDVDLYSSAKEVLDFVVKNGILRQGTLLWYDDWGGSPRWKEDADGESLAHKEMCETWHIECEMLHQVGNDFPHVQRLYVVK